MRHWFIEPVGFLIRLRTVVKFFLHLAIFVSAYHLAFLFRFDFSVPLIYLPVIWGTIPVLLLSKALGFFALSRSSTPS